MMRTASAAASFFCLVIASCPSSGWEKPVQPSPIKTALYRISERESDGACVHATLTPVRNGGAKVRAVFCNSEDVAYLKDETARHWMATVLDETGAEPRLLAVTVGLDVSVVAMSPAGDLTILALPRPSPLRLPAALSGLRDEIDHAVRRRQPVAFALSDSRTILDAAAIDRETALAMLGMRQ